MQFNQTFGKALSLCLIIGALAACSGAAHHADTYTDSTGAVMFLDNPQEACRSACNADYDRCMSTSAAQEPVGRNGQMTGVLGAVADCKADLKSCLRSCKSR
ncbi:MAG: hypothetical protein AB7E52_00360 [Bdellovibrionales bacterium]